MKFGTQRSRYLFYVYRTLSIMMQKQKMGGKRDESCEP
jgi:hypothetical protein